MDALILIFVILILAIFAISAKQLDPMIKGNIGESIVSGKLHKLPLDNYVVINDLIIKNQNGSSQIDHVVICPYGIIVIETKFYKGWIFGSEEDANWTQVFYKKKLKFLNPIIQNKGHIKALKYHLPQYSHIPYYPIVVLAGSSEFKSFDKVKTPVIDPRDLNDTVANFKGKQVLSQKDIFDINNILNNISCNDKESTKEHIQYARKKKSEYCSAIIMGRCPKCGGILIERKSRYGRFLGCSNYPNCNFHTE